MNKTVASIAMLSVALWTCTIANPLLGEWRVYRLQGPDGAVVELPSTYDLRIVYYERYSVQYEPGKDAKRLDYSLRRDGTGLYIRVNWNGRWYGQRFTVLDNGDIRWDLLEPGTMRPAKMWMRRVDR